MIQASFSWNCFMHRCILYAYLKYFSGNAYEYYSLIQDLGLIITKLMIVKHWFMLRRIPGDANGCML